MVRASRSVARVVDAVRTVEGAGFEVRRPFPTPGLDAIDPLLLLDEMGPSDLGPREAKGAPDHPHRGFETVTYLLSGSMEHRDSQGNHGVLRPGDVQWMTAGSGVIHSEMPERSFFERGGRMHGFQLWVNLPAKDKMVRPRYQDTPAARIPKAETPDGLASVRVIAGEALGAKAVIDTRIPILYHHWTLRPGASVRLAVPRDFALFAYVFAGEALLGADARPVREGHAAVFSEGGDEVLLAGPGPGDGAAAPPATGRSAPSPPRASAGPAAGRPASGAAAPPPAAELLLIGGVPLHEPIARYGPFVMNTRQEILQAFEDFQTGHFGAIPAAVG